MVFSSLTFLCAFLPVVYILYRIVRPARARNVLLVAASFLFYAYGEPVYVVLMAASIGANYFFGRLVRVGARRRKYWLAAAVVCNLGLLGVFKYTDMIIGTLNTLFVMDIALTGIDLPIGISFYTFQALSYVVDVYREEVPPQRSFLRMALYVSFFPQLIAGPIVKYHDIEDQLEVRELTPQAGARGAARFCVGLAKKVLIANQLAVVVDALYALPEASIGAFGAWTAAGGYMLQIYFDFSGYSDMAIGLGSMFGFTFPENFNYPYAAVTMKDFWRRWHMSLTSWFRQYLYIPLGGNRKGKIRTCCNKVIVFFATGLWHGPSWTFVVWGLVNGGFLLLEDAVPLRRLPKALGHVYTVAAVCTAFVLFRASTLSQGFRIIGAMFGAPASSQSWTLVSEQLYPGFVLAFFLGTLFALPVLPRLRKHVKRSPVLRRYGVPAAYIFSLVLLSVCLVTLSASTYNPFIYFRF